jgi:maleate isomerase
MKSTYIKPQFKDNTNPRIGLVALSTDFSIERDFNSIFLNLPIDLFVNRLPFYNPLTDKNLVKMTEKLTEVTENILPNQTLDAVAYGCTSGTIVAGVDQIINKIQSAKPNCKVITPITSAVNALKHLNLKKISVFTPYPQAINEKVINYFKNEGFVIHSFASFNLESDLDIGKIDPQYLLEVLTKIDTSDAEALFISCTALPVFEIIQELENKIKKIVLSSNQALIWDSIRSVGYNSSIEGYGKLLRKN